MGEYKMKQLKKLKQALTKDSSLNYENHATPYAMWKAVLDRLIEMEVETLIEEGEKSREKSEKLIKKSEVLFNL